MTGGGTVVVVVGVRAAIEQDREVLERDRLAVLGEHVVGRERRPERKTVAGEQHLADALEARSSVRTIWAIASGGSPGNIASMTSPLRSTVAMPRTTVDVEHEPFADLGVEADARLARRRALLEPEDQQVRRRLGERDDLLLQPSVVDESESTTQ